MRSLYVTMTISGLKEAPFFYQKMAFHFFSCKNGCRFITYMILKNISIRINEYLIQLYVIDYTIRTSLHNTEADIFIN